MTQLACPAPTPIEDRRFVEDLLGLLAILQRGWHFIAVSILICLTLAALYLVRVKPIYMGSARLLVLQQGGQTVSKVVTGGKEYFEYAPDEIPTHLTVIRSPVIVERAIQAAQVEGLSAAAVLARLTVKRPEPEVKILEIGYHAATSGEATRVVDAIVASYRQFLDDHYQKKSDDVLGLIAKVRDDLSNELRENERKYLEFHRQHPVFAVGNDGRSLLVRRLDQWDAAANEATMRGVKLQAQLDLARKLNGEGAELATIGSTIRIVSGGDEGISLAGLTDESPGGSFEQLGVELTAVERERRTTQRWLDHLRSDQAVSAVARPVSKAEVSEAFYADPEAARLRDELNAARRRHDAVKRVVRSPGDPSLNSVRRRVQVLEAEHDRLWRERRDVIVERLSGYADGEPEAAIRREEANLSALKSREGVLREEWVMLRDEHDKSTGHEATKPPAAVVVANRVSLPTNLSVPAGAKQERPVTARVAALIAMIEQGLRANEAIRAEMTRRYREDLDAGKEAEIDQLEEENLRADLVRQRTLFNSVVDQLKQAQLVSDHTMITAQMTGPTTVVAAAPPWMSILIVALIAGCGVGSTCAYLVDLFDAHLHTLPALRRAFDFSVLGLIPRLPQAKTPTDGGIGLICHVLPRSSLAEAYRSVRTNLELRRRDRQAQVLLITSPHSGDGKSTTASNLAISLAHTGHKVLLVDADLRRPSLHLIHGGDRSRGLVNILKDSRPYELETGRTPVENLDFLAAGPWASNPTELLGSPRFRAFLNEVRRAYDTVLIDSSPLLVVSDPLVIGAATDGVILVIQAATTKRYEAERTSELLESIRTPVLGTVVNHFTRGQAGHNYGQSYGYAYGYDNSYGYGNEGADGQEDRTGEVGRCSLDSRHSLEASIAECSVVTIDEAQRDERSNR